MKSQEARSSATLSPNPLQHRGQQKALLVQCIDYEQTRYVCKAFCWGSVPHANKARHYLVAKKFAVNYFGAN
jgi:hypothetical protein